MFLPNNYFLCEYLVVDFILAHYLYQWRAFHLADMIVFEKLAIQLEFFDYMFGASIKLSDLGHWVIWINDDNLVAVLTQLQCWTRDIASYVRRQWWFQTQYTGRPQHLLNITLISRPLHYKVSSLYYERMLG